METPVTSKDFDRAYTAPLTVWGDFRVPPELKRLVLQERPKTALELGCGVGRQCRYLARHGIHATGVDFSVVVISKAKAKAADDAPPPEFLVGDVTDLAALRGPFDVGLDIGCFHCLDETAQRAYALELARLLRPGGLHLLWVMHDAPSNRPMSADAIRAVFALGFQIECLQASRRRLVRSCWYWLRRSSRTA